MTPDDDAATPGVPPTGDTPSGDSSGGRDYQPPVWDSWSDTPDSYPPSDEPVTDEPTQPQPDTQQPDTQQPDQADDLGATQTWTPSFDDGEATQVFAAVTASRRAPGDGVRRSSEVVDDPDELIPSGHVNLLIADRYRLEEQLTQRRGTATWRAFDTKLSRPVLVHSIADDDPRRDAVLEAARKAAIATDSRFLRVLDAVADDEDDGTYVVCEYVPGQSLEKVLRQGPLSVIEAGWVVRELADALTPMHAAGLFHRRLNPDTVVVTATGSVKIVGFLIDAALAPDETPDVAWSEREEADVRALGQLLYACLVTRWPTMDETDRTWWGLRPAPFDTKGWLTPRQVRAGVSPALDQVCDQVLHERPRLGGTPLRSAHQIDQALSRVLGTADASADLEHRVRHPQTRVGIDDTLSDVADIAGTGPRPPHTPATASSPRSADGAGWGSDDRDDTGFDDEYDDDGLDDAEFDDRGTVVMAAHDGVYGPDNPRQRPRPHRPWLRLLIGLVVLSAIVGLVAVGLRQSRKGDEGAAGSPSPTAAQKLPIAKVDDFDPEADGGNTEENPNLIALAWDGKPSTAWTTLTYRGNPKLGGLKPGVGLVVDLGQPVAVGAVKLTLQGQPTAVALYVPQGNASSVTTPDMTTVERWKQVANNGSAGTSVTLKPATPVTTRFVLVYLTSLPKVDEGRYRAAIAEMEVTT
ncbi:protein kinase family protein [Aestuariimicrobium soli]|uniref:protein kinase family protein n=1 Tax=Aestuariimicrobium soli TaxID=2035834 RepID=UPI003EBBD207